MQLSTVPREIRYALTLLAEAHRGDDTLAALLERFSEERDALPRSAREAWIDLLRETGQYEDAIQLALGDQAEAFSREERRRLLEMYREAGRDDEMVTVYREWIATEPGELVWRQGLSRHFLERGDREEAAQLWRDWFDLYESKGVLNERCLEAAETLESLGLDDLAIYAAEAEIDMAAVTGDAEGEAALLFLYDLHRDRGNLDEARVALERLDTFAEPGSPARMPLSDCFERLGELEEAVRVLENVREARGIARAGEDLEMRLAWLYSEVGREEQALELWRDLWKRVKSVARGRFVEDRMMTVAARLGVLADIAVELERALFEGEATERESGLLVRLYTKVGDAVSAAEIVDEFLAQTGGSELEALTEKARVYLACNDFYHYEKAVARLIEKDPEGRPDYYRQLAMSQLERGKPDQARRTLMRLKGLDGEAAGDDTSSEFEAGVLALSGLREDAIAAYRRGLSIHPERIDSYLLMAGLMKQVDQSDRAVGMFQYLAETADRDDLFTIAIDGLLNMVVDAPPRPRMLQWARRITLERLAGREDAPYLYQLLSDLAEETDDGEGQLAALENSLASAGPRRASILRELMDLSKPVDRSFGQPSREGDRPRQLAYGRRLIGLGELVPPEVYLDLGDAFLEAGDEASAARTFDLTLEFPDGDLYQQQSAERFERAGFVERARERYTRVLSASPSDVPLLVKVGELEEALGRDDAALPLYSRALSILLRRKPLFERADEDEEADVWMPRNVNEFDQYSERVLVGLLSVLEDETALGALLDDQRALLRAEVPEALEAALEAARVASSAGDGEEESAGGEEDADAPSLANHPRLVARAGIVRRAALASGRVDDVEAMDRWLFTAFPRDGALLSEAVEVRVKWGRSESARRLVGEVELTLDQRAEWLTRLGAGGQASAEAGAQDSSQGSLPNPSLGEPIALEVATGEVLGLFASGKVEGLRDLLRRVDLGGLEAETAGRVAVLMTAARALGDPEIQLRIARDWLRFDVSESVSQYQVERKLEALTGLLDEETGLALARYFVGLVLDDPEKNARYVTILPELAQKFGTNVVETESVRTLLDGFGDRYAWGLGPVLALLPTSDRVGAIRGVWPKLEAANRASFLLDLVTEAKSDLEPDMAAFVSESFGPALEDADDFIEYSLSELVGVEHSHAVIVKLGETVKRVKPGLKLGDVIIAVQRLRGAEAPSEDEELLAAAADAWSGLLDLGEDEWVLENARRELESALKEIGGEGATAALLAKLEEVQGEDSAGGSPKLALARASLLADADDAPAAIEVLNAALEDDDENLELLRALRLQQVALGLRMDAAFTRERVIEATSGDSAKKRELQRMASDWEALRAPDRVLRVREELGEDAGDSGDDEELQMMSLPGGMIVMAGPISPSQDGKKGLKKSFKDVLKALEEGEEAEAALIFRRLWRQFPVGQPTAPRFGFSRYRRLPLSNLRLPDEEEEGDDESAAEGDAASRAKMGGLVAYEPEAAPEKPEPPNAYDRIGQSAGIVAEQERFLRTVRSFEVDRLQKVLEGLLRRAIEERGEDEVMSELLARAEEGIMGRVDQVQLLSMLDRRPQDAVGSAAAALKDLVKTMPPRDASQIRRLARVFAISGQGDSARALYRWCALQVESFAGFGQEEELDVVTRVSTADLVKEARDHLKGEDQLRLIEMVLEATRPTGDVGPWQRRSFDELVLSTWREVLGPTEALEKARSTAEAAIDLSTGLRRTVALRAAPLFLYGGDHESALRAVEVGVAALDPDEVTQPTERWYRVDPTVPGRLATRDLRELLPVNAEGIRAPDDWFRALGDALIAWLEDDRVRPADAVRPLAILVERMHERGLTDEAAAIADRLAGMESLPPASELWVIDALRLIGGERAERANAREAALLVDARLLSERVPGAAAAILEEGGPEAMLTAVERVLQVNRDERLLALVIRTLADLDREEEAQTWRDRLTEAQEAARRLEALDAAKK
ncbi:MAG: hypothetical protein AAGG01_03350 [Planctomycetota bacterium]